MILAGGRKKSGSRVIFSFIYHFNFFSKIITYLCTRIAREALLFFHKSSFNDFIFIVLPQGRTDAGYF